MRLDARRRRPAGPVAHDRHHPRRRVRARRHDRHPGRWRRGGGRPGRPVVPRRARRRPAPGPGGQRRDRRRDVRGHPRASGRRAGRARTAGRDRPPGGPHLRAVVRRPRGAGDLPSGRPPAHRRPQRPCPAGGARRARGPRVLLLPPPARLAAAGRDRRGPPGPRRVGRTGRSLRRHRPHRRASPRRRRVRPGQPGRRRDRPASAHLAATRAHRADRGRARVALPHRLGLHPRPRRRADGQHDDQGGPRLRPRPGAARAAARRPGRAGHRRRCALLPALTDPATTNPAPTVPG
ncbi:hypothetical protein NOCARDAX2BIS_460027 [Nocardioides sp. AX2bis]|nr:hypothetical protein NOCARDAX2BIS_460027 [Nocardioides sp. AX2bis]